LPERIVEKAQLGAAILIAILETLLAALLAAAVAVGAYKIASEIAHLLKAQGFQKSIYLSILDSALLLILAIDVTRTLLTAVVRGAIPLRIVVEVATLAVLREFISIEIRQPTNSRIAVLTLLYAVLVTSWVYLSRMEARRALQGGSGASKG